MARRSCRPAASYFARFQYLKCGPWSARTPGQARPATALQFHAVGESSLPKTAPKLSIPATFGNLSASTQDAPRDRKEQARGSAKLYHPAGLNPRTRQDETTIRTDDFLIAIPIVSGVAPFINMPAATGLALATLSFVTRISSFLQLRRDRAVPELSLSWS